MRAEGSTALWCQPWLLGALFNAARVTVQHRMAYTNRPFLEETLPTPALLGGQATREECLALEFQAHHIPLT